MIIDKIDIYPVELKQEKKEKCLSLSLDQTGGQTGGMAFSRSNLRLEIWWFDVDRLEPVYKEVG